MAQLNIVPLDLNNLFMEVYAAQLIYSIIYLRFSFFFFVLTIHFIFYMLIYSFYASLKIRILIVYLIFHMLVIFVVLGVVQFKV
jgi:hypothetical protein